MRCKGVAAKTLLLLLAPIVVVRGQEGTNKAGLEGVVRLYEEDGKALIDSLEKNYYGRNTSQALELRGSTYLFSPTDPKDHLATHFLRLPAPSAGKGRVARISLSFVEPEPSGSKLVIAVQIEGYVTLQQLQPRPDSAATLSTSEEVNIPASASTLRLTLTSTESEPTNLPSRVRIECGYSRSGEAAGEGKAAGEGPSVGLYVLLIAVGIITLVVIFRVMRKRPA